MPLTNVTVDDAAAIFEYYIPTGQPWTDSPTSDQELNKYWDSTYHSSNWYGAQASVRFLGTAVYLFAAKRSRHGIYDIHLDGQKVLSGDSYAATPIYNQIMYNATGLSPTWHNLTIINADATNQTFTEVDYIRWTTLMPDSLTEVFGTTIPYSPDNMTYSSLNAWTANTDGNNPSMVTSTDGASVNITFNGNGIEVWGKTGLNFGTFSAQVDGYDEHQLSANSQQSHDALLFRQDNLTSGTHTIQLTNRGARSLAITSAKPILWRDPNNPNSPNNPNNPYSDTPQSGSHSINAGVIAGAVVGVVVGLAILVFMVLFALRRRRKKQERDNNRVHSSHEPAFIDATPFELPVSPSERASGTQHSSTRHSKIRNEGSHYPGYPVMYQPVLGSPGMSSRGSFDTPPSGGLGVPSSNVGGSSSGRPSSSGTGGGKHRHTSEPTPRDEIPDGVEVIRDRDAGPILLPPAYSSAMEGRPPVELPGSFAPSAASLANPAHASTTAIPTPGSPALPPGAASPVIPTFTLTRE